MTKKEKYRWVQPMVIALLVVVVLVLTSMIHGMQNQIDRLGISSNADEQHRTEAVMKKDHDPPGGPAAKQPDSDHFDIDSDWFSSPFDPDRWDPFAEMQRMQDHMNRVFSDAIGHFGQSPKYRGLVREPGFTPDIDVHEEKDSYVIRIDLPGVDKSSINVNVEGKMVTVSGTRSSVSEQKDKSGSVVRSERRTGSFSRTVMLPGPVDASKMQAKNEKGVFTLVFPKAD